MSGFLHTVTSGNPRILRRPLLLSIVQALLQGQPYFVILLVILELLNPLRVPGTQISFTRLWFLVGWIAVSLVLLFFFGARKYSMLSGAAYTASSEGRLSLGDHLRTLSMGFFKGRDPGDITALMLQDYTNVEMLLSHILLDAISALALPVVFLMVLIPYDWRMALVTLAPVPLAVIAAVVARWVVSKVGRRQISAKNDASSRMLEYLDGMKSIKSYNLHGKKFSRLRDSFERLRRISIRLEAMAGPSVLTGIWILQAGIAALMLVGIGLVLNGTLSIPLFLFFLVIGTRMYDPLVRVLTNFAELSYFSISVGRIKEIFATKPLPEPKESVKIGGSDIEFENVSFRYHDVDVLKNVSFSLPESSMTALVGPSGSGKTTITRLIARFWDVENGTIKVGGVPIQQLRTDDLLAKVSIVFQDVYLFNDTVMANIKVGNPDATDEEVMAAARKARCHEFVDALPKGYDTVIGEGGATLSGGEKQRLSIARAILKDAPIVLLDEATASLDPENELFIQEAIAELVTGRTLIVIAHRLSTVTKADQIIVLNEGHVVEKGTHEELIKEPNGIYARMWGEQARAHSWKLTSGARDGS